MDDTKDRDKKRILIVHNYYQIHGGEDTVVANEKELLEKNGHYVQLYQRSNEEMKHMNVWQKAGLPFAEIFSFRTYREVKHLIRDNRIDIVHVHNTLHMVSPSVYYAAFHCKVPVVQTVHNFRLQCPAGTFYRDGAVCEECMQKGLFAAVRHSCYRGSRLQTMLCVLSTALHRRIGTYRKLYYICLTSFNKDKLLQINHTGHNQVIDPEKVFVKPNFSMAAERTATECLQKENYYIYAGRLDELKGISVLLSAWENLGELAPQLKICGTGPQEDMCRQSIAEHGLAQVQMLGMLPQKEVLRQIGAAKALILPTQWYEGFPMTIAEAFAMHTPVIVSDLGNAGSLITEGINGWKFRTGSPQELADKVMLCEQSAGSLTVKTDDAVILPQANYRLLCRIYEAAGGTAGKWD